MTGVLMSGEYRVKVGGPLRSDTASAGETKTRERGIFLTHARGDIYGDSTPCL